MHPDLQKCRDLLAPVLGLPAEFAEWASSRTEATVTAGRFRILSPRNGDSYAVPTGVDPRYSTLGLRAAGSGPVRWMVDGQEVSGGRWRLVPGDHVIRAESATGQ